MSNLSSLKTVISGSYRKHLNEMFSIKDQLTKHGIDVLAPVSEGVLNPGEEFVLLDMDPVADHRILQDSIFAKMRQSSFLVVANKKGYIGKAALIEIGYAIALGLQILTLEPVEDPNIKPYCRLIADVFTKAV